MKIYGKQVSVDAPFSLGDENSLLDVIQNDEQQPLILQIEKIILELLN